MKDDKLSGSRIEGSTPPLPKPTTGHNPKQV